MDRSDRGFLRVTHRSPILRIGLLAAILSGWIACAGGGGPMQPSGPPAAGSTIVWAAIGASDVAGVGSSVPCLLQDCADGKGYIAVTARQLRAQGFTLDLLNLGIPTAVIGRDFETLGQQYNRLIAGNFIQQEMPFIQRNATLVTIFAGLNEINTVTAALGAGVGGSDPNGYIDTQVRAFGTDFAALMRGVSDRAGSPRLVILNVPNPAAMPYLAAASLAQRQAAQRLAVGMTRTVVNPLVSSNALVVDLMCDARSYQASTYSSDGLHPNDAGYAFVAAEVARAITTSNYPAPQGACSFMSIVP
jgi:lysophospholipase L1-like esterase